MMKFLKSSLYILLFIVAFIIIRAAIKIIF